MRARSVFKKAAGMADDTIETERGADMGRRRRVSAGGGGGSSGVTLVELAVTMAGLVLVSAGMISFFVGTTRLDDAQAADDAALEAVRDARARLSRDVREARRFAEISVDSFTVWLDDEWDGLMPEEELVTWAVTPAGILTRASGTSVGRSEAFGISPSESRFTYDSTRSASVTRAFIHLVVEVEGPAGGARTLGFEVALRNVP